MSTFFASYPAGTGGSTTNPSVGINGAPAPAESTEVGGINPSGNLQPLQTDVSGNLLVSLAAEPGAPLHVIVDSSALPTGASTSALQTTGNASLSTIATNTTGVALDSHLTNVQSAPGTPQTVAVTVQGNASGVALPVTASTLPLPSGAATAANQTNGSQKTQIVDGSGNVIGSTSNSLNVDVTQPLPAGTNVIGHVINDAGSAIIGKVGIDQTTPGTTNGVQINAALPAGSNNIGSITNITGTISLPTGASTAANQTNVQSAPGTPQTTAITIQGNSSGVAVPVTLSAASQPINTNGSVVNTTLTGTTASSASAPANAVGFILEASSGNSDNIRWCIGSTASASVGLRLEPGRDTGYIPCKATISVCAEASTTSNAFQLQWILSS